MKVTFETTKFSKILGGICQNVLVFRILLPNDDVEIMNFTKKNHRNPYYFYQVIKLCPVKYQLPM